MEAGEAGTITSSDLESGKRERADHNVRTGMWF